MNALPADRKTQLAADSAFAAEMSPLWAACQKAHKAVAKAEKAAKTAWAQMKSFEADRLGLIKCGHRIENLTAETANIENLRAKAETLYAALDTAKANLAAAESAVDARRAALGR